MSRTPFNTRTLLAGLLLVAVGASCVALGFWQLDRARERRGIALNIEQGRAASALDLNALALESLPVKNWTPATAQGHWRDDLSVLLENRNLEGRPGLWLATPFALADDRAVLVLRGWFARPLGAEAAPRVPTSIERQSIQGELIERVPRLFELWSSNKASRLSFAATPNSSLSATVPAIDTVQLARLQNLSLTELSAQSGLRLLPVVLMQTSASNDGLIRVWPEPSVDADKNVGYATQWFGFAAICFIALLVFAWRVTRRR
ncbi:MAG: SURF1 family protein [Alcaligenaceae bacterium]